MARRTDPTEDDWRNVEDSKKRKQIQDRLAQRARRKRLREAKENAKPIQEHPETQEIGDAQPKVTQSQLPAPDVVGPIQPLVTRDNIDQSSSSSDAATESSGSGFLPAFNIGDLSFCPYAIFNRLAPTAQPDNPMTVFSALYMNGQVLGLSCSTSVPAKSTPVSPDIPASLQPTDMQLTTIHPRWIDRFPFPKVRDSLITLSGVMDDEEFVKDLFTMPSFEIAPGHMPWDPMAWRILKGFAEKWGYLFV